MNIYIGQKAVENHTILEMDINKFADVSGDYNPVHIDQIEAEKSVFGRRIAHGFLVGSYISSIIGMRLPGNGTIYLEQNIKFLKPVFIGDIITVEVTVVEILNSDKNIIKLNTIVENQNKDMVVSGYAVVKAP